MPRDRDERLSDCTISSNPNLGAQVNNSVKKVVGASALGAISVIELLHLQQASATPVTFTGSTVSNPKGGSVQVAITVDGASGVYRITSIPTPVQPGGGNASYANKAIPTLTNEALAAQSASINGVSGASEVSAAWISSLSSAIAQAAAAGEAIGTSTTPPAPAPAAGATSPSTSGGNPAPSNIAPTSSAIPTSVATAPTYDWVTLNSYSGSGGGSADLTQPLNDLSNAISRIASSGGEGRSSAIAAANAALNNLRAAISGSSGNLSASAAAYVNYINQQMQFSITRGNQQMADYFAKVILAANKLYADAEASAAAIKAEPAPTVTVTVTATPAVAPKPTINSVINKNTGVIKKTFTCIKTVSGVTTRKTISAFIVKCPTGFTLVKK